MIKGSAPDPEFGPIDPGFAAVVNAWPSLLESARANIVAMVRAIDVVG
jgi:hypothetical protein